MPRKVGAIVLAAGFSNRFGSLKLLASMQNGATVFSQTLSRIRQSLDDVLVVTRPELQALLAPHCENLEVFEHAEQGMGATLAFAVSRVKDWDGCLICLADMPFISSSSYAQLASAISDDNIVIPTFEGQAGNPVGFGKQFFDELCLLKGDAGGRPVVRKHADAVSRIEIDDPALLDDIDTPADLKRLLRQRN